MKLRVTRGDLGEEESGEEGEAHAGSIRDADGFGFNSLPGS